MWSRWLLCLVLALVGAAAGLAASARHETMTTAEARLAVGSNSLKAFQVAGFATASEALAANYSRFVAGSSTTTTALSKALGPRVADVSRVDASPIPDSNLIRIEVEATSPAVATTAADAVARSLVSQVNRTAEPSSKILLADYRKAGRSGHPGQSNGGPSDAASLGDPGRRGRCRWSFEPGRQCPG